MRLIIIIMGLSAVVWCSVAAEGGKTISCTMKHSAVAELDEKGRIDVLTTDSDEIEVTIEGIGKKKAIFNKIYPLTLMKEDQHAYYYLQPSAEGFIMWVYFKQTHVITYAKLRAFPLDGSPASYLMIAKCE